MAWAESAEAGMWTASRKFRRAIMAIGAEGLWCGEQQGGGAREREHFEGGMASPPLR